MSYSGTGSSLPTIPTDPEIEAKAPCRLWVGNLDLNVTEFQLLKVLQKFGSLDKFDFLYHKAGPDAGKPRGYCFVTYSNRTLAEKAKAYLHNKKVGSRHLIVKQAHGEQQEDNKSKVAYSQPTESSSGLSNLSKSTQIAAIEAKLKMMEQSNDMTSFLPKTTAPPPRPSASSSRSSASSSSATNNIKISKLAEVAIASGMRPVKPRSNNYSYSRDRSKPYSR